MLKYLTAYGAAAVVFLALDACWLALVGPRLYRPILGDLLADKVSLGPAIAFYLLYVAGIVALAVRPAWTTGAWTAALVYGLMLGLIAYGTYDLTNQATMRVWSMKITLADMAWGAFVTGAAATAGLLASRLVAR